MTKRYFKDNGLLAVPFDKGTGIFVMKKYIYAEILSEVLNLEQFVKINPTHKNTKEMRPTSKTLQVGQISEK